MKIVKLALDGFHHGSPGDAVMARAESRPFVAILGGVAVAAAAAAKNGANEIAFARERITVGHQDSPLHARHELAPVQPEPDVEISGLLADGRVWLGNDRPVDLALRQHAQNLGITRP